VERDEYEQPNGLCFSVGEELMYVNDTTRGIVMVYRVEPDGSLTDGGVFVDGLIDDEVDGVPYEMKCDQLGNVWVTGPGGIHVFDPGGAPLGFIAVDKVVANLHFGGADWRTLFITSSTSVRAIDLRVAARLEPFMRSRREENR